MKLGPSSLSSVQHTSTLEIGEVFVVNEYSYLMRRAFQKLFSHCAKESTIASNSLYTSQLISTMSNLREQKVTRCSFPSSPLQRNISAEVLQQTQLHNSRQLGKHTHTHTQIWVSNPRRTVCGVTTYHQGKLITMRERLRYHFMASIGYMDITNYGVISRFYTFFVSISTTEGRDLGGIANN